MARYHGKNSVLYISTSGSGTAVPTVSMAGVNADFATDTVETTSFTDPNKQYVQGLKNVSGAFNGFLDDTGLSIFTAADSTDGCKMYIYPFGSAAPTVYWYGPAWLNASIATGVSAAVTVSGNFVAAGAWGRKP